MPKPLRATTNMLEETQKALEDKVKEFLEKLKTSAIMGGTIKFEQTYAYNDKDFERPEIEFSPEAWIKMVALVATTGSEIAWNGFVERKDDTHFYISDIVVYPQKVTGVTVDIDEGERSLWLSKIPVQQRCKLNFQGHSHVNMSTSPSSTDMTARKEVVDILNEDGFYIFLIMNKSYEYTIALYDMVTNALYETKDIDVVIPHSVIEWCASEKKANLSQTYSYGKSDKPTSKTSDIIGKDSKPTKEKKQKSAKLISASQLQISSAAIKNYLGISWPEATAVMDVLLEEVNDGVLDNSYLALISEARVICDEMGYDGGYGYGYGYSYGI